MESTSVDDTTYDAVSNDVKSTDVEIPTRATPAESDTFVASQKKHTTILVSAKRPRSFYERTTRELFASGIEELSLSALGSAICTAVDLASLLVDTTTATITSINTSWEVPPSSVSGAVVNENRAAAETNSPNTRTIGIKIVLKRHADFKGSRIAPGQISWCVKPTGDESTPPSMYTPVFLEHRLPTSGNFTSLVSGNSDLSLEGSSQLVAVKDILLSHDHTIANYQKAHEDALKMAWDCMLSEKDNQEVEAASPTTTPGSKPAKRTSWKALFGFSAKELNSICPDLKSVFCRPCVDHSKSLEEQKYNKTGAVFIDIFADKKNPFLSMNYGIVYVVGPKGSDYKSKEDFLDAVRRTSANIMECVCDYNGKTRREFQSVDGLRRIMFLRVFLFSGGVNIHEEASKLEVAKAILHGLNSEFHYGPAPLLDFAYDDDVFKQAWVDVTGLTAQTTGTRFRKGK